MEWLYCWLLDANTAQAIDWKSEAEVADELGFRCHSFDFEQLIYDRLDLAFADLPEGEGQTLVYRGWILSEDDYRQLEDEVVARGYQLHNNASQYEAAIALPNYYEFVEDLTPPAVWTWEPDIDEAWELAQSLGKGPLIIKDHVKSAKEAWLEACFIPEGASFQRFKETCEELQDRRGPSFTRGFVVRPFVPLVELGALATGGPVFEEYRLIFWNGKRILADRYSPGLGGSETDFSKFDCLSERIDSNFFVADVARTQTGELILIEINEGGAAGLPPDSHPIDFYAAVARAEGMEIPEETDW